MGSSSAFLFHHHPTIIFHLLPFLIHKLWHLFFNFIFLFLTLILLLHFISILLFFMIMIMIFVIFVIIFLLLWTTLILISYNLMPNIFPLQHIIKPPHLLQSLILALRHILNQRNQLFSHMIHSLLILFLRIQNSQNINKIINNMFYFDIMFYLFII